MKTKYSNTIPNLKLILLAVLVILIQNVSASSLIGVYPDKVGKYQNVRLVIAGTGTKFLDGNNSLTFLKNDTIVNDLIIVDSIHAYNQLNLIFYGRIQNPDYGQYQILLQNEFDSGIVTLEVQKPEFYDYRDGIPFTRGDSSYMTIEGHYINFLSGTSFVKVYKRGQETSNIIVHNIIPAEYSITLGLEVTDTAPGGNYEFEITNSAYPDAAIRFSYRLSKTTKLNTNPFWLMRGNKGWLEISGYQTNFLSSAPNLLFITKHDSVDSSILIDSTEIIDNNTLRLLLRTPLSTKADEYKLWIYNLYDDSLATTINITDPQISVGQIQHLQRNSFVDVVIYANEGILLEKFPLKEIMIKSDRRDSAFPSDFNIMSKIFHENQLTLKCQIARSAPYGSYSIILVDSYDVAYVSEKALDIDSQYVFSPCEECVYYRNQNIEHNIFSSGFYFEPGNVISIHFTDERGKPSAIKYKKADYISEQQLTLSLFIPENTWSGRHDAEIGFLTYPYYAWFKLYVDYVTGNMEIRPEQSTFNIYPNPIQNDFIIEGSMNNIDIYNLQGRKVKHIDLGTTKQYNLNKDDIGLKAGLYYFKGIDSNGNSIFKKVLVN